MRETITNVNQLAKRGRKIYNTFFKKLEKTKKGKIIAIEVDSHEGFLGNTTIEAGLRAKKKYPKKMFFFKRIGYDAVHSLKGFVPTVKT